MQSFLVFPTDEYFDTNKKFKLYFCFSSPLTSLRFYARRAPIDLVSTQEFWLSKGLPQPRAVTNEPRAVPNSLSGWAEEKIGSRQMVTKTIRH